MPPRKRACTTGIPRPTLRGLVIGSRLIEPTQTLTPCIVFGDEFSSWLSCLGELGFRATALVLESPMFVDLARSLVDTSCQIHVGIDSKFSHTSAADCFYRRSTYSESFTSYPRFGSDHLRGNTWFASSLAWVGV
eukprot:scaffold13207_cov65-Attheya_sp.AAC.2